MAPGKEETFQLFCCIYEATMIDKDTASKPLKFEMNIGMHYHFFYFCNFFLLVLFPIIMPHTLTKNQQMTLQRRYHFDVICMSK